MFLFRLVEEFKLDAYIFPVCGILGSDYQVNFSKDLHFMAIKGNQIIKPVLK